ncbi:hypothetical protein F2Y18_15800 [Bacillus cereus]|uniref:hypothetical protein n=1 Tax=Bacillus cereus TaxID=1396 RepID=UPI00122F7F08|nr:hypothetical protein [Bacillus cereus]KAA2396107.1 hypothetical protein F2Y18_15800 [Bacillus cereus]
MSRGFRKKTMEEISSESLFKFFKKKGAQIFCWHPPDGKAYFTPLYHFPEINELGERTGRRNHIDLIIQIQNYLMLLEVKGEEKDFYIDINKLKSISNQYNLTQLIKILETQGAIFANYPSQLILGLASYDVEFDDLIPNDMALFKATENQQVEDINSIAKSLLELL